MTKRTKLEFPGTDGLMLAGLLETPDTNPHYFALFAHWLRGAVRSCVLTLPGWVAATVSLAGRPFTIKKQFPEDLAAR